jgi:hypothetical protein
MKNIEEANIYTDRSIKDSLTKSIVTFCVIFLMYLLIIPFAVGIVYGILSVFIPSVFPDPNTLSDAEFILSNMILNEISNLIIVGIIIAVSVKNKRIKEIFGPRKATKGKMLLNTLIQGAITFGFMFAAMYVFSIISLIFPASEETNAN